MRNRRFVAIVVMAVQLPWLGTGCSWNEQGTEVMRTVDGILGAWHQLALQSCKSLADDSERALCLSEHRIQLTRALQLRRELRWAYAQSDAGSWESSVNALSEVFGDLMKENTMNPVTPLGPGGLLRLDLTAAAGGETYTLENDSTIEWGFGSGPAVPTAANGRFSLTLTPDGNGGFTGSVDAFEISLTADTVETSLGLFPGGEPGRVAIDASGTGTMSFQAFIASSFFPLALPWQIVLPIESADPLTSIHIRTAGLVPAEEIFPVVSPVPGDCNQNGVADADEIAAGDSKDCDEDGIPDECQWENDCNLNGIPDDCDILADSSRDLNENGILDECEPEDAAASFPATLVDGALYPWDIQADGSIGTGKTSDENSTFASASRLEVNGEPFPEVTEGRLRDGGQTVEVGPEVVGSLEVTRRVFVPSRRDGFARTIEILHNPTESEAAATVSLQGRLGTDDQIWAIESSSGDWYFDEGDLWVVLDEIEWLHSAAVGLVTAGPHARIDLSTATQLSRRFSWSYDISVPAGETAAILHFAVQDIDPDRAALAAQSLVHLEGSALDYVSPELLGKILNFSIGEPATLFVRGDANADGAVNITDALTILGRLFLGDTDGIECLKSADTDDTGETELTDAVLVLQFLFLGGPQPAAPFPDCGPDESADSLSCDGYGPCEQGA